MLLIYNLIGPPLCSFIPIPGPAQWCWRWRWWRLEVVNHHWCHFLFLKCADVYKSVPWQSNQRFCINQHCKIVFSELDTALEFRCLGPLQWRNEKVSGICHTIRNENILKHLAMTFIPIWEPSYPLTFYWVFQLWWCPFINKFFRHGILGSQSHEIVSTDIWSLIALLSIQALQTSATIQQK